MRVIYYNYHPIEPYRALVYLISRVVRFQYQYIIEIAIIIMIMMVVIITTLLMTVIIVRGIIVMKTCYATKNNSDNNNKNEAVNENHNYGDNELFVSCYAFSIYKVLYIFHFPILIDILYFKFSATSFSSSFLFIFFYIFFSYQT